jgi:hypothetical protein
MMDMADGTRARDILVAIGGLVALGLIVGWGLFVRAVDGPVLVLERRGGDAWVAFERDGGFVGHADRLELAEDGRAILRDQIDHKTVRFTVRPQILERIRAALEDVDWEKTSESAPAGSACADCITYTVIYDEHYATGVDLTTANRSTRSLVVALEAIVDRAQQRRMTN